MKAEYDLLTNSLGRVKKREGKAKKKCEIHTS